MVKKYCGNIYYDLEPIKISDAVRPKKGNIIFDFEEHGWKYTIDLQREGNSKKYSGVYTARNKGDVLTGDVSAIRFMQDQDIWLIGKWNENGETVCWWTKLMNID